jgi:uncharacterized protein involved in exopolysaccharide biosynthesis
MSSRNRSSHADSEKLRAEIDALRKSENEFKAKFGRIDATVKEKDAQIEDLHKQMQREVRRTVSHKIHARVCDGCVCMYIYFVHTYLEK